MASLGSLGFDVLDVGNPAIFRQSLLEMMDYVTADVMSAFDVGILDVGVLDVVINHRRC